MKPRATLLTVGACVTPLWAQCLDMYVNGNKPAAAVNAHANYTAWSVVLCNNSNAHAAPPLLPAANYFEVNFNRHTMAAN